MFQFAFGGRQVAVDGGQLVDAGAALLQRLLNGALAAEGLHTLTNTIEKINSNPINQIHPIIKESKESSE